jgi:cbb3-type cytochrome oxidase subunit 3
MKKEFNGETWLLIFLILLSVCSYFYLYQNNSNQTSMSYDPEVSMEIKEGKLNDNESKLPTPTDLLDQKLIKKGLEKVREWLPVN